MELLLPAGSLPVLRVAVLYGADAVYIGGEAYSLRAKAENFTIREMGEGIAFAHEHGKKVYVTVNIFAHHDDLAGVRSYLRELCIMKPDPPDALFISDPGVFLLAGEICPDIPVFISTQANSTNEETFRFWYAQGVRRIVCARELSLREIGEIRKNIPEDMEIEAFVHGAMCISYSGRCLLSAVMTGRGANEGECSHPCRWRYALSEEKRPGQYFPIEEDDRGSFILNSRDLCMIEHIPDLFAAGIDSAKVEGRMKNALYVATTARAYRRAIDDFSVSPAIYEKNLPWYRRQVRSCTYRPFTTGFFYGNPGADGQIYEGSTYLQEDIYLGFVEEVTSEGMAKMRQKNKFCVGDTVEVLRPDGTDETALVRYMTDEEGVSISACPHARQVFFVDVGLALHPYDILRKKVTEI